MRRALFLFAVTASLLGSGELFDAARTGDATKVRQLLNQGVDVNAKWRYGQTALLIPAWRGQTEALAAAISATPDAEVK